MVYYLNTAAVLATKQRTHTGPVIQNTLSNAREYRDLVLRQVGSSVANGVAVSLEFGRSVNERLVKGRSATPNIHTDTNTRIAMIRTISTNARPITWPRAISELRRERSRRPLELGRGVNNQWLLPNTVKQQYLSGSWWVVQCQM